MGTQWQMERPWYLIELLLESGELMVNGINCRMKFKASISTNNAAVLRNYVVAIKINTVTRTYNLKHFSDRLTFVWISLSRPDLLQSDLVRNHGRLSMKTCAQKLRGNYFTWHLVPIYVYMFQSMTVMLRHYSN